MALIGGGSQFVDTYSKVATAKLYSTKTPITAADLLNDKVLPLFAEYEMGLIRILTDRGTEYCVRRETHDYQPYLALNEIEYTKTKVRHPQTNGICERFHKTILNEFYQITFRKKFICRLTSCGKTWMNGCITTIMNVLIKEKCVLVAHQFKH